MQKIGYIKSPEAFKSALEFDCFFLWDLHTLRYHMARLIAIKTKTFEKSFFFTSSLFAGRWNLDLVLG